MNNYKWNEETKVVTVTPAGCRLTHKPNESGWAVVLRYKDVVKALHGIEEGRSPFRMEILALVNGLSAVKERCTIVINTTSEYLHDQIERIYSPRRKKDAWYSCVWRGKAPNADLWKQFIDLKRQHRITSSLLKHYRRTYDHILAEEIARHSPPAQACEYVHNGINIKIRPGAPTHTIDENGFVHYRTGWRFATDRRDSTKAA